MLPHVVHVVVAAAAAVICVCNWHEQCSHFITQLCEHANVCVCVRLFATVQLLQPIYQARLGPNQIILP